MGKRMQLLQNTVRKGVTRTVPDQGGFVGWVVGCMRRLGSERRSVAKQMHVLETLPLGGKRQLILVSCAGRLFLVGGSSDSIGTIVHVQGAPPLENVGKERDEVCL